MTDAPPSNRKPPRALKKIVSLSISILGDDRVADSAAHTVEPSTNQRLASISTPPMYAAFSAVSVDPDSAPDSPPPPPPPPGAEGRLGRSTDAPKIGALIRMG